MAIRCNDAGKKQVITWIRVWNQTVITIINIETKNIKNTVILKTNTIHVGTENFSYA
jgi:hypothetical protein